MILNVLRLLSITIVVLQASHSHMMSFWICLIAFWNWKISLVYGMFFCANIYHFRPVFFMYNVALRYTNPSTFSKVIFSGDLQYLLSISYNIIFVLLGFRVKPTLSAAFSYVLHSIAMSVVQTKKHNSILSWTFFFVLFSGLLDTEENDRLSKKKKKPSPRATQDAEPTENDRTPSVHCDRDFLSGANVESLF